MSTPQSMDNYEGKIYLILYNFSIKNLDFSYDKEGMMKNNNA